MDAGDDLMRQVGQNFRALQVEVNSLRAGINFGKEIGKVNTATTALKWTGRGLGAYNAYQIDKQFNAGQINTTTMFLEQGTNAFSTFGGIPGASWGVGWEIGRAITNIPSYQEWKQETWLPWRKEKLGY